MFLGVKFVAAFECGFAVIFVVRSFISCRRIAVEWAWPNFDTCSMSSFPRITSSKVGVEGRIKQSDWQYLHVFLIIEYPQEKGIYY